MKYKPGYGKQNMSNDQNIIHFRYERNITIYNDQKAKKFKIVKLFCNLNLKVMLRLIWFNKVETVVQ